MSQVRPASRIDVLPSAVRAASRIEVLLLPYGLQAASIYQLRAVRAQIRFGGCLFTERGLD